MTLRDDLLAVAALLEPEGAWTQRFEARDHGGLLVATSADGACSWCLDGAIRRVTRSPLYSSARYNKAAVALSQACPTRSYINWNDAPGRTQAEVVALVRRAAEAAS